MRDRTNTVLHRERSGGLLCCVIDSKTELLQKRTMNMLTKHNVRVANVDAGFLQGG